MDGLARLLRQVRHGLQLFPPCFRDLDRLLLRIGCLGRPSHLVGVAHDLAQVLGVQRIQDAEEVVPLWALALGKFVGEMLGERSIFLVLGPQSFDGELVILGNFNRVDGVLLEELLLAGEDLLEEVLINVTLWWQEVLKMLVEVHVEILLRLELVLQLLGLHVAEGALLARHVAAAVYLVRHFSWWRLINCTERWLFFEVDLINELERNHIRFRLSS